MTTDTALIPINDSRWVENATLIFRVAGHRNLSGEWIEVADRRISIKVVTHPPTGDSGVLERLPEGARLSDCRVFYVNISTIENTTTFPDYSSQNPASTALWVENNAITPIVVPEASETTTPDTVRPTKDDSIEYRGNVYDVKEVGEWRHSNFLEILTLNIPKRVDA